MIYEVFDPPLQLVPASSIASAANFANMFMGPDPNPVILSSKPKEILLMRDCRKFHRSPANPICLILDKITLERRTIY